MEQKDGHYFHLSGQHGNHQELFSLQNILSLWQNSSLFFFSESLAPPLMFNRTLVQIKEVNSDPHKKFEQDSYNAEHCG